jgi:hypothetical protein
MLPKVCRHSMAWSQLLGGGESLSVWRIATNTLNKEILTAGQGRSFSFVSGWGATTCYELLHRSSNLGFHER